MTDQMHTRRALLGLGMRSAIALTMALGTSGPVRAQSESSVRPATTRDRVLAALPELQRLARATQARTAVPGLAISLVCNDEVVSLQGLGVRAAGTSDLVDADTVFQLASVSKPIASTIVAGLVGDGVVGWDDPVVRHDPDFALADPLATREVTLRDLFAHRSGLPDHAGDLLEDLGFDRGTILHRLRHVPIAGHFRSQYAYTNFGVTEAAVAAANAAGQTWEDLAVSRLYERLGMASTSSRHADYLAAANRAMGHIQVDGAWVPSDRRDADAQSPAGGVSSSVRDLAQWLRLQLNRGQVDGRQVVDAEALAETHRPQVISRPPRDLATERAGLYGLGWAVTYDDQGGVILGHSGGFNLGAASGVALLPAEHLGIVVLTNGSPVGVPETLVLSLIDLVRLGSVRHDYLAQVGPAIATQNGPPYGTAVDYTRPPSAPAPAATAAAYAGTYANAFFGDIRVMATDRGLVLQLGPHPDEFPLTHFDGDVFTYQPAGENAYGVSGVTFIPDADDVATSVAIENLDHDGLGNATGLGLFTRVQGAG